METYFNIGLSEQIVLPYNIISNNINNLWVEKKSYDKIYPLITWFNKTGWHIPNLNSPTIGYY